MCWLRADHHLVNKVDREGRDTFELLDEIADMLALDVSPQGWLIGMGGQSEGVSIL
jgi:peptide chain release factor 3